MIDFSQTEILSSTDLWAMKDKGSKKELARILFYETDLTQKQIAERLDTTEQTISKWANEGNWRENRAVETLSPDKLIKEFYYQCDQITDLARNEGRPLHTGEADALVKLSSAIKNLDKRVSPSVAMAVLMRFNNYLKVMDPDLVKRLTAYQMAFIQDMINPEGK